MSCIGNFSNLGEQLQSVILALLADQELVDLVACTPTPDPYSLLNTRIYPDLYRPPTDQEIVYICAYYDKFRKQSTNPYFKHGRLNIRVIYHRNLIYTSDGKLRHYEIMHRIDDIMNRNAVTNSVSKDWFDDASYSPINELYNSFVLTYENWNL